jgi:hypothetical protein
MTMEYWWQNNDKRKPKHPEQNLYQCQSIMNPTQKSMASDLDLHSDRPMTNHLGHGKAHLDDTHTDAGSHVAKVVGLKLLDAWDHRLEFC